MAPNPTPRVELDDALRQRPELVDAVTLATARLVEWGASFGPEVTLSWRIPAGDPAAVELTISETTDTGTGVGRSRFPLRYLDDQVNCDISVRRTWDDVLEARIDRGLRRLGELIARLEEEEAVHAQ
ncbi:MAG: hypothetical protein K2P78_11210 [Gemmataceae bacterium]|nr:hypothetical protein [Gemmataceae bacterium]